ncbi:uncharacterized protein LOC120698431 [Panicum virgatum]|uniref:Uncharacterized protein n=1 Tax=Panicum virgatum TaxID=38727 RepID=A0A8T0UXJ9_PANVG|nr:uncharacterized protein LOC120698431 [Panicum virgatum]KAG2626977.1 hypothetical protein PVAP13_3KG485614 [Panicum virgatum]
MSSQRPGRHQRRASQSVFVLPENLATLDVDAAAEAGGNKVGPDGASAEQQARPPAGRHHRRAMSVAVASRDLELIKEDLGSYKIGA